MRAIKIIWPVVAALFLTTLTASAVDVHIHDNDTDDQTCHISRVSLDWDDDVLVIRSDEREFKGELVEITEKFELYVNHERVRLTVDQEELVMAYYQTAEDITDYAIEIGVEGAKIGLKGAAIGIGAIGKVFKLLSPHYDSEDLERDIERESRQLEREAEDLERRAEDIEDMADQLDVHAGELRMAIPELGGLEWF